MAIYKYVLTSAVYNSLHGDSGGDFQGEREQGMERGA